MVSGEDAVESMNIVESILEEAEKLLDDKNSKALFEYYRIKCSMSNHMEIYRIIKKKINEPKDPFQNNRIR